MRELHALQDKDVATSRYSASIQAHQSARVVLAGGVNSNFRLGQGPCPLTFDHATGSHLFDVDGNEYIDYVLGMGPMILGHRPAPVMEAVSRALERGQLFGGQHVLEQDLARLLVDAVPCAELVRIGQSGTEMVQLALRLARAYTGRQKFIRFFGHYHGWTDPVYVSQSPEIVVAQAAVSRVLTPGQSQASAADVLLLNWNSVQELDRAFSEHGSDIAAIIMEPMMCNTGVIEPNRDYLQSVRDVASTHGSLLIFDEVITGFRVALGGAQERFGITPDLAVFAKAVASGFPVAVLAGRAAILGALADGSVVHAGTYNAGLTATAAAASTVKILTATDPYPDLYARGRELIQGIRGAAKRYKVDLFVDGLGPVFHTRFGQHGAITDARGYYGNCDLQLRDWFVRALQDQGVRLTSRGTWFLSTAHTARDLELTIDAVERVLKKLVLA